MRKENQDSWSFLAEKLDLSEPVPGEMPLDTAAAWNAVQSRLRPEKKRAAVWYWSAAAIVILSFGTAGFFGAGFLRRDAGRQLPVRAKVTGLPAEQSKEAEQRNEKGIRLYEPSVVSSTQPGMVSPAFAETTAGKERNRRIRRHVTAKNNRASFLRTAKNNMPTVDSIQVPLPDPAMAQNKTASVPGSAGLATVHRSLRVVHLNELDEPGLPDAAVNIPVRNQRLPLIRLLSLPRIATAPESILKPATTVVYTPLFRINLTGNQ